MRLQWRRLRERGRHWTPPRLVFTVLLVSLCASCYASIFLFERTMPQMVISYLALSREGLANGYCWQFATCIFASPSGLHLVASLVPLFLFAGELESIVGPRHVAGAFFFSIFPASAASLFWSPAVGQMGLWPGVCGLLAVLATMLPMLEIRLGLGRFSSPCQLKTFAVFFFIAAFAAICFGWLPGNSPLIVPVAILEGYFYARWIGYGAPTFFEVRHRQRRLLRARRAQLSSAEFIAQEVDPILEKIFQNGVSSLTRAEKRILHESAAKAAAKKSENAQLERWAG